MSDQADLPALLVHLWMTNGSNDPEDAYEQALHDVAAGMGVDLDAALAALAPVLPPLERTEQTPWRTALKCPACGAILDTAHGPCPDPECEGSVTVNASTKPKAGDRVHPPVQTAPGDHPGCPGVLEPFPSGALACHSGCVVIDDNEGERA